MAHLVKQLFVGGSDADRLAVHSPLQLFQSKHHATTQLMLGREDALALRGSAPVALIRAYY